MALIFITDARFYKTSSGKFYAGEFSFSNVLWERYNEFFDKVYVIGRVFEVDNYENKSHLVDNVEILPLIPFESPISYIKNSSTINSQIKSYFNKVSDKVIIIRGAGSVAYSGYKVCKKLGLPYGLELIGDPYEVFAPGVVKHPLRPLLRYFFTKYQKEITYNAKSVIYVTEQALQKRYPANANSFTTFASDVFVEEIVDEPRRQDYFKTKPFKVISIGAITQNYKSPDDAIRAIHALRLLEVNAELHWLGHGELINELKDLAKSLQINDYVHFHGSVSSEEVIKFLNNSDAFILISKTEGLPRALVEAMARGLPCIGTNVGGIPELVSPEYLVKVGDYNAVANKLKILAEDPIVYMESSKFSIQQAAKFEFNNLEARRKDFFASLF